MLSSSSTIILIKSNRHNFRIVRNLTFLTILLFLVQQMNNPAQNTLALYFERSSVGLSFYNSQATRIQCSSLTHLCPISYPLISQLLTNCTTILTNNPSHDFFSQADLDTINVQTMNEKIIQHSIIQHHLSKTLEHLSCIKNHKAYFKKMKENELKFNALGLSLHYLNQGQEKKIYLEDIEYFTDTLLMLVNIGKNQLEFLEITKEDIHPSLIKGKGNSKEGYSVISAYQAYLFSTGSKKILRFFLMNPTYNCQILEERHRVLSWMKHHMKDTHKYSKYFRNVHYLESILKKFGRMNAEEQDWKKLMKTLETMVEMVAILKQDKMPRIIREYVDDFRWNELIEMYSIFRQTFEFSPFSIRKGIDQTLDQLKQTYDNMPHILTLVAKEQEWDLQFRIVFMTQVGYLIKIDKDTSLPQEFDSEDWVLQFSNNSGKFYSNQLTLALDREYGDTFGEIQDIEKKIIFDMQALVVQREMVILQLYWKLCEIQCFWGVSQLSKNMCRPKLSSESLIISNGWHMLLSGNVIHNHAFSFCQSQAPRHQVFNSERNLVNMNYSNRCMIITGPNASGKSVYMKQLGVFVYLAHVGFFVPASLAEVPLTDSILFVGKSQSIYSGQQCGFVSELSSLSSITQPYIVSNKSLILIDELGAEIDYENSLKLIYATVQYLTNATFMKNRLLTAKQDEFAIPMVVIVTHLSEILKCKVIEESYKVRFLTMMVEEEGICLYKIRPGLVSKGYGIRAAAEIMPGPFVELGKKYLEYIEQL